MTGFQENGHLGTLARYIIDTPQRDYAVFKVRGGCVDLTIQITLKAKNKKVNLNNVNIWWRLWQRTSAIAKAFGKASDSIQ
ncbi:hypothetical protein [Phormidium tenue]|uniref:Uncharacterized protein n=1 Tax=Phormidium tenue FACHB-1050 TaxID=2692857 RepID=A0ABR8CI18_9CYAN|nr:hypothetical protein [Phormidium tenue]MBD2319595.1 hypothetical protein [Phormidium tenue FACHB-1050]